MTNIAKRPDGQWRARYRDDSGREHAKHFRRRVDAKRWLDEVTTSVVTGQYVNPRSGKVTFRDYAEQWRGGQVHRPSTQVYIERQLRRHAYPVLGDRPMSSIRPSDIQARAKGLTAELEPGRCGARDRLRYLSGRHARPCDYAQSVRWHQAPESDEVSR